jgi:hypothetical protein
VVLQPELPLVLLPFHLPINLELDDNL